MKEVVSSYVTDLLTAVALVLVAPAFMRLGWNVIAWNFNLPTFSYLDMIYIYLGLDGLTTLFHSHKKEN